MTTRSSFRRRSRRRGAALVESVVAMPVFIILYFGFVYLHRVYYAKLEALDGSRSQTWSLAAAGGPCGTPNSHTDADLDTLNLPSDLLSNEVRGDDRRGYASQQGVLEAEHKDGDFANNSFGRGPVTVSRKFSEMSVGHSVTVSVDGFGTNPTESASTKVMCNEPLIAQGAQLSELVKYVWNDMDLPLLHQSAGTPW